MRKTPLAVTLALAALASAPAAADEGAARSRAANFGVVAGGILGAVLGGPAGGIAGAALGGYAADRTEEARRTGPLEDRLGRLGAERDALASERESLAAEVAALGRSLELERQAAARARDAATVADGLSFAIPFRSGSSELPGDAGAGLAALAMLLESAPDLVLRLDGYADPRGGSDDNLALSTARAEAVRERLVAAGVDPDRILVAGHGELPAAAPNDPEAWAMQRLVSLTLQLADDRLAARPGP